MQRCLQLAAQGQGTAAPNPVVGAVLVHDGLVIGEGFHHHPGGPHAEVVCVASVKKEQRSLIQDATLYVSLEPCSHHGRTPPCTDLILKEGIRKVVVGCTDPNEKVNGKGIAILKSAGVEVLQNVLENECVFANRRFFTIHSLQRPYIILKWAHTADGFIGTGTKERLRISNEAANRLVHKWRSQEAAIMIGTNTAILDNPSLTARHWPGKNPVRIVIDKKLRVPQSLQLFNDGLPTWVVTTEKKEASGLVVYHQIENTNPQTVVSLLQQQNIQSVFVEGGRTLLQSFIDAGLWDECRIITAQQTFTGKGVPAPTGIDATNAQLQHLGNNSIATIYNTNFTV